jgi:hypothetical protein
MKCIICGKETSFNSIRLEVCWDCAENESILSEGLDIKDKHIQATTPMEKLKVLIWKGWSK